MLFSRLILFNFVAECGRKTKKAESEGSAPVGCPLVAAMCVCMPWDLTQTSDKLEKSLDWLLFNFPLTHNLRSMISRNADVLSKKYDVPRILKVSDFFQIQRKMVGAVRFMSASV